MTCTLICFKFYYNLSAYISLKDSVVFAYLPTCFLDSSFPFNSPFTFPSPCSVLSSSSVDSTPNLPRALVLENLMNYF